MGQVERVKPNRSVIAEFSRALDQDGGAPRRRARTRARRACGLGGRPVAARRASSAFAPISERQMGGSSPSCRSVVGRFDTCCYASGLELPGCGAVEADTGLHGNVACLPVRVSSHDREDRKKSDHPSRKAGLPPGVTAAVSRT